MKKKITLFLVIVLGVIGVGSGAWLSKSYAACQLAQEALITDDNITVENGDYISFTPKNKEVTKGYIFYPGGGVKAEAYAPICRQIAEDGYEVVIAKMPLNLAVLSPNKADEIIKNTYRTLMTRGMKGCYVYCTDKKLNSYISYKRL